MTHRSKVLLNFAIVYVIWGSTYLAIGVGVEFIPPSLFAAARFLPGGLLMLVGLAALRRPVRPSRRDLAALAASAVLLLVTGNGLLIAAEKTVPSGLSALVIATVPLWIALLEAVLPRGERLSLRGLAGIGLGLLGLAVLSWPRLQSAVEAPASADQAGQAWGIVLLLASALSWASGTVLMRRRPIHLDPLAVTGWQMLLGGLCQLLISLVVERGQPVTLNTAALAAIGYLIVFGSWIGFSAYVWLVHHVPAAKVATYAYVNPVIAVLLGWLVRGERVDAYVLGGMLVILLAVGLVNSARVRAAPPRPGEPSGSEAATVELETG